MDICRRDDLVFFVFTRFWAETWTYRYADVMTSKEPVLLLRSKNIVTLYSQLPASRSALRSVYTKFDFSPICCRTKLHQIFDVIS